MRTELSTYLHKWRLTLDGAPFSTPASQLAYVTRGNQRAVLKIPSPESDEHRGAEILIHWGTPAARVLEHDEHALLLERALPGTMLSELFEAGKDEDATKIWCDVVHRLHTKPAPDGWPGIAERGRSFHRTITHPLLPPAMVAAARDEFFDLCATQSDRRFLLHADLHHFNILEDNAHGWIVIDPKGFVGELEWETATFLRNPIGHWDAVADPKLLERRVQILCDSFGFDPVRVLRWCAAFTVLSSIWSAEGYGDQAKLEGALKVRKTAQILLGRSSEM